jgi:DMSO/TMAO reductase YedYZ heme-binding membrane subunit
VAFLVLHVLTAILDPYVRIGWAATVLPFASPYRAMAVGLGALAVDLDGAVLITSLARRRLGYRAWRAVHWLGYRAWPAAFWHSGHRRQRSADLVGGAGVPTAAATPRGPAAARCSLTFTPPPVWAR